MHNVNLSQDDVLEFLDLPHKRRDHTSSSLDSSELEVGVLEDHPKMSSDMLATLILLTVKADTRTSVPILIANIRSQLRYTSSYRKAWIAKQKALEKIHGGWDTSYNEVWQWCQVLERYVPGWVTDLETEPSYYNNRLLRECQVFKHLFWSYRGTGILAVIERQGTALFLKRAASYKGQMQGGRVWCAKVLQEINKAKVPVNTMHTVCHDRDSLWSRVTEFDRPHEGIIGGKYRVHLRNKTCDCERFDVFCYPCAHVITAC
ncbi:hypothetical protein PVK06_007886 [Gossypium arboreum]|uniref:SWIM-type domain-containing protein n=1 Tax=Gossypium arboreum TaxID=29729 RepID=A0ABR0QIJ9_GOSAR|nr:hypothetical protein PVK06_007886 [Gossypium arboreum]